MEEESFQKGPCSGRPSDEDWQFLEERLQACLKNVRGLFPQSYKQLLEQERLSCDDPLLCQLPEAPRKQAIAELIQFCQAGIRESLSEQASAMVDEHTARMNELISVECIRIFEFAERMQLPSGSERSGSSWPNSLQSLTKRGMAQPTKKTKKNDR